jgi:transposase
MMIILLEDNAAIHKTSAVLAFMNENNVETFEWPPQSPDLSPIENIWNVMKMKALKPRLRDGCVEMWGNLENHIREHLIETFGERLVTCLAANGDIIKF